MTKSIDLFFVTTNLIALSISLSKNGFNIKMLYNFLLITIFKEKQVLDHFTYL